MNCQEVQATFGDLTAGALLPETRAAVETHTEGCPGCASELRRFNRCIELLDHVPRPTPPADLWLGIRARIDLERSVTSYQAGAPIDPERPVTSYQAGAPATPRRSSWLASALAGAGGFALALLVIAGVRDRPANEIQSAEALPPAMVSATRHNMLDPNGPMANGSTITVLDSVLRLSGSPQTSAPASSDPYTPIGETYP